jgi:hypothetical protein
VPSCKRPWDINDYICPGVPRRYRRDWKVWSSGLPCWTAVRLQPPRRAKMTPHPRPLKACNEALAGLLRGATQDRDARPG